MRYEITRIQTWIKEIYFTPTPIAAGVCRIALAIHFMMIVWLFCPAMSWLSTQPQELYNPVGMMSVYGTQTVPVTLITVMVWCAKISLVFLLLGLYTRLSLWVTTIALLHCCSAAYSFATMLPHPFIPGQLAAVCLMFGVRSPLSLDYLWCRARQPAATRDYWLTPRLGVMMAMFALGYPFANAALFKIYFGNGELFAWVYSDSMRNILIFQWWKFQEPLPSYLEWVTQYPLLWKGMALANLVCQFIPVFAFLIVRRPMLRLLLAVMILAEVVGLIFVMKMWGGYGKLWLIFAIFFVDWDSWTRRWFPHQDRIHMGERPWTRVLVAWLFVGMLFWGSCTPDYHRARYPLQPFTMFSSIQAHKPYSESQPLPIIVSDWAIESAPSLTQEQHALIFQMYHSFDGDPVEKCRQIRALCQSLGVRVESVTGIQSYHVIPVRPLTQVERQPRSTLVRWQQHAPGEKLQRVAIRSINVTHMNEQEISYKLTIQYVGEMPQKLRFAYLRGLDKDHHHIESTLTDENEYELTLPNLQENVILVLLAEDKDGRETSWYGWRTHRAP
jgi:hypothetical protein